MLCSVCYFRTWTSKKDEGNQQGSLKGNKKARQLGQVSIFQGNNEPQMRAQICLVDLSVK